MPASCFMTLLKETSTKSASHYLCPTWHARVIGNKSHADTCQPSTVGFQILNNSERTGRGSNPRPFGLAPEASALDHPAKPSRRIARSTRFTPDTSGRRDLMQVLNVAIQKELNTASQQHPLLRELKQYRNKIHAGSHLASKRRMRTKEPPHALHNGPRKRPPEKRWSSWCEKRLPAMTNGSQG